MGEPGARDKDTRDISNPETFHSDLRSTDLDTKSPDTRIEQFDAFDTEKKAESSQKGTEDTRATDIKEPKSEFARDQKTEPTDKESPRKQNVSSEDKDSLDNNRKPDEPNPDRGASSSKVGQLDESNNSRDRHDGDIASRNPSRAGEETAARETTKLVDETVSRELFSSVYEEMLKGPMMECLARKLGERPDLVDKFFGFDLEVQQKLYVKAADRSNPRIEQFIQQLGGILGKMQ
jgi:hypothetical protein